MEYLVENKKGEKPCYETSVEIYQTDKEYIFDFVAKTSTFYCPYKNNNEDLFDGDVCEVFIGSSKDITSYYEIEVSPEGAWFLAKVKNSTVNGKMNLDLDFIENKMLKVKTEIKGNDYTVRIAIDKKELGIPIEEIVFNAFRIDTDGIKSDLHLFALNPTKCNTFHKLGYFVELKKYL